MPTQPINIITEEATLEQLINELAKLQKMLRYLLNGQIDFENIRARSIKADNIEVGTLTAEEIMANTITADKMNVTELSAIVANLGTITAGALNAVTIIGSVITGGTLRTAASGERIEISGNSLKTFNLSNNIQGLAWGDDVLGTTYGDVFLYDAGTKVLVFQNDLSGQGYTMKAVGTATIRLGEIGQTNFLSGTWEATNLQAATFSVRDGTDFETLAQANSTATTVAGLVNDFNSLLSKLRSLNILA